MVPQILQTTPGSLFRCGRRRGDFGIEIELEGRNIRHNIPGWLRKEEGSLRGENAEYVIDGVIEEHEVPVKMEVLREILTQPGRELVHSNRTSTHIHLNVSDLPFIDIFGYVIAFTVIEPLFVRLYAPERDGNLFCMTSYDTGDAALSLKKTLKALPHGGWKTREKYTALNMATVSTFGSVECRVFPSTVNPDTVVRWCRSMMALRRVVEAENDKTFLTLINQARTLPGSLARRIFNRELNHREAELIQFGCEQAYELAVVLKDFMAREMKKELK